MSDSTSQPDRASRFLDRVDSRLAALPTLDAKLGFLDGQLDGWQRRYGQFLENPDREPVTNQADQPHASDFLLTIAGLEARRAALASP